MDNLSRLSPSLEITKVINGMWQIADMERNGNQVSAVQAAKKMLPYVEAGLTTFDMADHYGSSELIAGAFEVTNPRKATFLTKWVPPPGPVTKQDARGAVLLALEKLKVDHIALMQFHTWNYADPSWLDALFYLQELKHEGLIRNIGVTNFDTAHLNIALKSDVEVISNQVCYSLLDQRAGKAMTRLCDEHGVKLLAFGTLAGGFISERWLGKPEPAETELVTWSQMKYKRYIDTTGGWSVFQELLETLSSIAKRRGVSISNVATKYILQQPNVAAVIIGTRLGESEHINETKLLFDFDLNDQDLSEISAAKINLKPVPGDCGDEYRKPPFLTASGDLSHHLDQMPAPFTLVKGRNDSVKSGTVWEELAGFSRAVKKGKRILISGTTATHRGKVVGGNDPAAQTHFIIDKIEGTLQTLGASLNDVVRTRIFIRNISDWEAIARAHGNRLRGIEPANTMVRADLIGDEYLVEIEAEAEEKD